MRLLCVVLSVFMCLPLLGVAASAQDGAPVQPSPGSATLTVRSNLVLVPALVKTKSGEIVFSLNADDFVLTDNGAPQSLQLEPDTDAQPLALVVIVQTGGQGALHLGDYTNLGAVLDAVIGSVPHRVALVSFDGEAHLEQDFTTDTDTVTKKIDALHQGDGGSAILDGLSFGLHLLESQPPAYRRAVLLLSETVDGGSRTTFEEALRAVDDTNTAIYSFGFSSTRSALKHQAAELPRLGGSPYMDTPYAAGGCMSREAGADPDAHGKRSVQALDCASDLLPPLRLARMAFLSARDGFRRNIPESVANLTGGEYFAFKNAKTLSEHLASIANDVPNHYVLSFRPQAPSPGLHALALKMKDRPELDVRSRSVYWVDAETALSGK